MRLCLPLIGRGRAERDNETWRTLVSKVTQPVQSPLPSTVPSTVRSWLEIPRLVEVKCETADTTVQNVQRQLWAGPFRRCSVLGMWCRGNRMSRQSSRVAGQRIPPLGSLAPIKTDRSLNEHLAASATHRRFSCIMTGQTHTLIVSGYSVAIS